MFQPRENEVIDRVARPIRLLHGRGLQFLRRHESPMRRIAGPFLDPAIQQFPLRRSKRVIAVRRRHHFVGLTRRDPPRHFAPIESLITNVQPQFSVPGLFVRSMAFETGIGKNRFDTVKPMDRFWCFAASYGSRPIDYFKLQGDVPPWQSSKLLTSRDRGWHTICRVICLRWTSNIWSMVDRFDNVDQESCKWLAPSLHGFFE